MIQPIIDKILSIVISKKLTVFFIATIFIILGKLNSEQWVNISMVYIGSQGAVDLMIQLRKK
jgi:hypothetical protein